MCAGLARLPRMNMEGEEHQEGLQLACILGGSWGEVCSGAAPPSKKAQTMKEKEQKARSFTLKYTISFLCSFLPARLPFFLFYQGMKVS